MSPPCALCKGRRPRRTHVFPQNSRAEVQHKWVKALELPQKQEDEVLAEMRQMEQKGSRPRWCSFHFDYDSAGIHFPKYFDPEEGKTAQGWKEDEDKEEEEEVGPSNRENSVDDSTRDGCSTLNEPRRSSRRRTSAATPGTSSTSPEPLTIDKSLQKILLNAGISLPGMTIEESPTKESSPVKKGEAATSIEKTLQSIIMEAGLPVPETLQAKTGVLVDEEKDGQVLPHTRPTRQISIGRAASLMKNSSITVADAKRQGTFVRGTARGGATLSSPKMLTNPMAAAKFSGDWPKVMVPKPAAPKLSSYCYNHNTMEKYDDNDTLLNFKMPCTTKDCRSELTVIMNRARDLEHQFDDLANNVLQLVQMYRTKTPIAFRPPQNLATIQGRAAAVAGPVYGVRKDGKSITSDSLAVLERRQNRRLGGVRKEPERLLTDEDLASTVRRKVARQEYSEEEEEEDPPELDDDDTADDEWKPSSSKRPRRASGTDADTASEASPPMLEINE